MNQIDVKVMLSRIDVSLRNKAIAGRRYDFSGAELVSDSAVKVWKVNNKMFILSTEEILQRSESYRRHNADSWIYVPLTSDNLSRYITWRWWRGQRLSTLKIEAEVLLLVRSIYIYDEKEYEEELKRAYDIIFRGGGGEISDEEVKSVERRGEEFLRFVSLLKECGKASEVEDYEYYGRYVKRFDLRCLDMQYYWLYNRILVFVLGRDENVKAVVMPFVEGNTDQHLVAEANAILRETKQLGKVIERWGGK